MNYTSNSEPDIRIYDIIWKLIGQWKTVLIVAILFAMLVSSFMYFKDSKAYEKEIEQLADAQNSQNMEQINAEESFVEENIGSVVQDKLESLNPEERRDVESLLQLRETYLNMQQYMDNSILMNTDPTNRHFLRMEYSIGLSEEDNLSLQSLSSAYKSVLISPLVDVMENSLGLDIDSVYVRELVGVSSKTDLMNAEMTSVVTIELTVPNDELDVTELASKVDNIVSVQAQELSNSICPHSMTLYFSEDYVRTDYDLFNRKTDYYQRYTNLKNNMNTLENGLSSEQKEAYESIKSQLLEMSNSDQDVKAVEKKEPSAPRFSKKWATVGFVLGIIVYVALYVGFWILRPRLRSKEEVQDGWNLKVIGETYHYSKKGFLRFANSKNIYNLQHKGKTNLEKQTDIMVNSISSLSNHCGSSEVVFAPVGLEKDVEKHAVWNRVSETLKNRLTEKGLSVSEKNLFLADDQIDEARLLGLKNVIPVVLSGVSKHQMLNELVADAMVYDINLMGAIFVEG